ncbi:DUF2285 domain-containing protein [Aureimonas ureilytica]|uniref:DNA -binding domain-containing protein n=1 Tax=Aureimonas ureilytica TaxID=401562 RepID=UPI00187BD99A
MPILLLPDAPLDKAEAALVPIAADIRDRVEALLRLQLAGRGRDMPDTRLTPLQRRRIQRAIRAADAHAEGASYRDIAEALHGALRMAREEDWRSSPLRTEAIDLVKVGLALIANGYRELLRHRRRS